MSKQNFYSNFYLTACISNRRLGILYQQMVHYLTASDKPLGLVS